MNINDFVLLVASREGKKKQVNIAQIKEVLKVTRVLLKEHTSTDIYKEIRKI